MVGWWGGLEKLEGGTVRVLVHEGHTFTSVCVLVHGCGRVWAGLCVCRELCEQAGVMEVKLGTPPIHCAGGPWETSGGCIDQGEAGGLDLKHNGCRQRPHPAPLLLSCVTAGYMGPSAPHFPHP